jgi:BNR repeat-containing family member
MIRIVIIFFVVLLLVNNSYAQNSKHENVTVSNAGMGWAGNSINTVVFRKNSLTSNDTVQFIGYYDAEGYVVIGKRNLNDSGWQLKRTQYKGNIADAHNSISIMLDGDGFLHIAWDHHNNPLHYCKSKEPLSLALTDMMPMTGDAEKKLSYPEFYKMPNGDLLFFYRDGGSGNGNLVINRYSNKEKKWTRLQTNLIDGEGKRNAYWQACVDANGFIHISYQKMAE